MKLFICGSRTITDKEWIFTEIEKCIEENIFTDITILEGEAKGVDLIAKEWAISHNIPVCHVTMLHKIHFFSVLSNNDSYIDLKQNTDAKVEGIIRSVQFSDFGNDYKILNLVIVEK